MDVYQQECTDNQHRTTTIKQH